jgi:hypothetical protein
MTMRNLLKTAVAILILGVVFFGIRAINAGEPWTLRFTANNRECVDILITNKKLKIDRALVRTQTPVPPHFKETVIVARRGMEIPIGKVMFSDFTTLPGRLTLLIGTHTMDITERAVLVDGREIGWQQAMENPTDLGSP